MDYRLATHADIPQLAKMRWDFQHSDTNTELLNESDFILHCEAFFENALEESWRCWVAVDEGIVVSHLFINIVGKIPKPSDLGGKLGYLTNVYTLPQFRNTGIGSELMSRAKNWCIGEGLELLIVWPSEESVSFYVRAGFKSENEVMELLFE